MTGTQWPRTLAAVAIALGLTLGSLATLRWAFSRVERATDPATYCGIEGAGTELDPATVSWIAAPTELTHTRVEPDTLPVALERIEATVERVTPLALDGEPIEARFDRMVGGCDATAVVLTGAVRHHPIDARADRDEFVAEVGRGLSAAGWRVDVDERPAIQTDYPLAIPGPVDVVMTATSTSGRFELQAPADGGVWTVRVAVDEHDVGVEPA